MATTNFYQAVLVFQNGDIEIPLQVTITGKHTKALPPISGGAGEPPISPAELEDFEVEKITVYGAGAEEIDITKALSQAYVDAIAQDIIDNSNSA